MSGQAALIWRRARPKAGAVLGVVTIVVFAVPAGATPLCRDLKGLYTPCAGGTPAERAKHFPLPSAPATVGEHRPTRPSLVAQGHLCRDTKGLFTPCLR